MSKAIRAKFCGKASLVIAISLALGALDAAAADKTAQPQQPPQLPLGVSPVLYNLSVPTGKIPTPEEISLGEKLFRDKRLSVDNTVSCETCHDVNQALTDHRANNATSEGVRGLHGTRNAPTVLNAMFQETQFWDGRSPTLEEQAKLPILNPVEMGQKNPHDVVAKVRSIPEYDEAFRKLNGREPTYDDIVTVIAAFERTQYSGNSPFDRFMAGDQNAIDASAKRGWALFNGKARCSDCHEFNSVNFLFSDQKFHNIGIAAHNPNFTALAKKALTVLRGGNTQQIDELALNSEYSDLGRFLVTHQVKDIGAFKTETLRNIGVTGPYMHDGSMTTLYDVIDHYNKGGVPNPYLDGGIQRLGLTENEINDLVAFLFTLTDDRFAELNKKEMARQMALRNTRPQRNTAAVDGTQGNLGDVAPDPDQKNPALIGLFQ